MTEQFKALDGVPTLAERAIALERIAYARCVCKRRRSPTANDITAEIASLHSAAVNDAKLGALLVGVSPEAAAAALRAAGLTAPQFEKRIENG